MNKNDVLYKEILKTINFSDKEIEFVNEKEYLIYPIEIGEHISSQEEENRGLFNDVSILNEVVVNLEDIFIGSLIEKIKRFTNLKSVMELSLEDTNFEKIITPFNFSSEAYKKLLYAFDDLNCSDIVKLSEKLDMKQKHSLYYFDKSLNFENGIPKIMVAVKKELSCKSLDELNILLDENRISHYFSKIEEDFYNNPSVKQAIADFEKGLLKEILTEDNNNIGILKKRI